MTAVPITEFENYENVLKSVSNGFPVYLKENDRCVYTIRTMEDEENFQKAEAMIQLLCELNAGIRSGENEGWIPEEDMRAYIHNLRNE